jgi:diguanylate cyclase (GGDEF)-like protein
MLQSTYSYALVALSLLVATLASYTTLDLAGRITKLGNNGYRSYWLAGGAFAMGIGIWSMHFVGMLAFSLPIPLGYDPLITLISLLIAVLVSYFALNLATGGLLSVKHLLSGGALMGGGIAAMHYTGMAAMRMNPGIDYNPAMFILSVLIAMAASTAALWIAFTLSGGQHSYLIARRLGAALVMGLAITGMHYTGMGAANFPLGSVCSAATGIDTNWLAALIVLATIGVLAITLVLSVFDARLEFNDNRFTKTLQQANEQLLYQATHDALTGLPNRVVLSERIQHAIDSSERGHKRFAVLFIDLDGFKAINDSMGHRAGDAVLKELAARLKENIRKEDLVARFGGDEFVVVVEDVGDVAVAASIAGKLFDCFQEDFNAIETKMTLSPSIGVSLYPDDGSTIEALLKNADAAMYEAKSHGRNGYRFFEPAMNLITVRTMEVQRGLRGAVEHDQLFLTYQPKFTCHGKVLLGAEALLRWQHPTLGLIMPDEFIPVAERSGQIVRIGHWVVERVCRQLLAWDAEGLPPVKVAVNLSPSQLRAPTLVEDMAVILARHGIAPQRLMFEITESVAMQNTEENIKTVQQLQSAGFDLAIDDFGTGYSSLSYLQKFAVRQLKVDSSFVSAMIGSDAKGLTIVSTIIGLAHSLDMEVVAEGVETEEQLALLVGMKCDQVQGFLLGRPLSSDAFLAMFNKGVPA